MTQQEIWKSIAQSLYYLGIKPISEVSNMGKVRHIKTKRVLSLTPRNGNLNRLKVQVKNNYGMGLSLLISHVVYETFVGNCYEKKVKHIDGNPRNNAIENLSL